MRFQKLLLPQKQQVVSLVIIMERQFIYSSTVDSLLFLVAPFQGSKLFLLVAVVLVALNTVVVAAQVVLFTIQVFHSTQILVIL